MRGRVLQFPPLEEGLMSYCQDWVLKLQDALLEREPLCAKCHLAFLVLPCKHQGKGHI